MAQRNEAVYAIAQDWIRWLDTRKFMGPPEQRNILAQFIASRRATREPNGPMSAWLNAFNLAITSLEIGQFVPFVVVYCELKEKPIKALSDELGIGRDAFYERAHASAGRVMKMTRQLVEMNKQMQDEVRDYV